MFWNYTPVTLAAPKLLLASGDLFGDLPPGDDEELLRQVENSCRSGNDQKVANSAVAKAMIKWRNSEGVKSRLVRHEPLRTTVDTLQYCCDAVVIKDLRPWVIHLDCRASMSLSAQAKELMKSLIYHTALIGNLRDAGAAILRFPKSSDGQRKAVFETLDGSPQYELDDILKRITETYSIWETIIRARASGKDAASEK